MISEIVLSKSPLVPAIHALAQAAYLEEAKLIGSADFPPLRESVEELRAAPDSFLFFNEAEKIIGVLSFLCDAGCVTITRLFVSPRHFRQGIARALLEELERRIPPATSFAVSTAEANLPAIMLYRRMGYMHAGTSYSPEGITLVHFKKPGRRSFL